MKNKVQKKFYMKKEDQDRGNPEKKNGEREREREGFTCWIQLHVDNVQ